MVYVISLLSVAAFPLAVAGYGGHLAAKVLDRPERRKALATVWALAVVGLLLSGLQQMLIYRSDRAHDLQQADLQAKAEKDQQQLREKLDSSLQRQEDVRNELRQHRAIPSNPTAPHGHAAFGRCCVQDG